MNALRIAAACVIIVVWSIVYLAPYFSRGAPVAPPELSAPMLLACVWLFGAGVKEARRKIADEVKRRVMDAEDAAVEPKPDEGSADGPK